MVVAWSTFGPHPIGAERFATVSSGRSFAQVAGAILGIQAQGQNPDKDEVAARIGLVVPGRGRSMPTTAHKDGHTVVVSKAIKREAGCTVPIQGHGGLRQMAQRWWSRSAAANGSGRTR